MMKLTFQGMVKSTRKTSWFLWFFIEKTNSGVPNSLDSTTAAARLNCNIWKNTCVQILQKFKISLSTLEMRAVFWAGIKGFSQLLPWSGVSKIILQVTIRTLWSSLIYLLLILISYHYVGVSQRVVRQSLQIRTRPTLTVDLAWAPATAEWILWWFHPTHSLQPEEEQQ